MGTAGGHAGDLPSPALRHRRTSRNPRTALGVTISSSGGSPYLAPLGIEQVAGPTLQAGGNMEGKEVRFGIFNSALLATATTDASCGAVNAMHDSFTPLGGLVPLLHIQLGEVVFGGVGSGLFGMLVFVVVAVFLAGLMVGRTPEYLGKKIESFEIKVAALAILVPIALALGFTAWPSSTSRAGGAHQCRAPRLQRDALCLLFRPATTTAAPSPD